MVLDEQFDLEDELDEDENIEIELIKSYISVGLFTVALSVGKLFWESGWQFFPKLWKKKARSLNGRMLRLQMIQDLLKNHQLIGLKREQIEELLGKPDILNHFERFDYSYQLGKAPGDFATYWLGIIFDRDQVIEIEKFGEKIELDLKQT